MFPRNSHFYAEMINSDLFWKKVPKILFLYSCNRMCMPKYTLFDLKEDFFAFVLGKLYDIKVRHL